MNDKHNSQVQIGALTSNVTVIDEDQLLTPAQLDKISAAVLQRIEQQANNQQHRNRDQAIARTNGKHKGVWR